MHRCWVGVMWELSTVGEHWWIFFCFVFFFVGGLKLFQCMRNEHGHSIASEWHVFIFCYFLPKRGHVWSTSVEDVVSWADQRRMYQRLENPPLLSWADEVRRSVTNTLLPPEKKKKSRCWRRLCFSSHSRELLALKSQVLSREFWFFNKSNVFLMEIFV